MSIPEFLSTLSLSELQAVSQFVVLCRDPSYLIRAALAEMGKDWADIFISGKLAELDVLQNNNK